MPRLGRSAAVKGEAAPPSSLGPVAACGAGRCARVARWRMVPHELVALDSRSTPLSACLVSRRQRVGRDVSGTAEDTVPPADTLSFRVASLSHRGRAGGPRAHAVCSEADAGMDAGEPRLSKMRRCAVFDHYRASQPNPRCCGDAHEIKCDSVTAPVTVGRCSLSTSITRHLPARHCARSASEVCRAGSVSRV